MMKSNLSTCLNDDSFGPVVHGCRGDFDFTNTFEEAIFSIGLSACFLLLTCLRIVWLSRKTAVLAARRFQALKLVLRQSQIPMKPLLTGAREPSLCIYRCRLLSWS